MATDTVVDGCATGPADGHALTCFAITVAIGGITGSLILSCPGTGVVDNQIGMPGTVAEGGIAVDNLGMTLGATIILAVQAQLVDVLRMHVAVDDVTALIVAAVTTGTGEGVPPYRRRQVCAVTHDGCA